MKHIDLKQINLTYVVCSAIIAIGMIGAGALHGLLSRNKQIALGEGAVYKENAENSNTKIVESNVSGDNIND